MWEWGTRTSEQTSRHQVFLQALVLPATGKKLREHAALREDFLHNFFWCCSENPYILCKI